VISESNDPKHGAVPDDQIEEQIDLLGHAFNSSGFAFELQNVSRVENAEWFNKAVPGSKQQAEMKKDLRRGDVQALNIYSVKSVVFLTLCRLLHTNIAIA